MKKFYETTYTKEFALNEKNELKQNVRNEFRSDYANALVNLMTENGFPITQIKEGLAVEIPNEIEGSITIIIGLTVKPLSFDLTVAKEEFDTEVAEKILKAEKVKAEKELKIANSKALKAKPKATK